MKRLIYLCSISALMVSCKPMTIYVPTGQVKRVVHEVVYTDTMTVITEVPEHYIERETRDTASYLSNPYAYSHAEVSEGMLSHSLGIFPDATVEKEIIIEEKIITVTDSIPYPVEIPIYVEKELRGWQKLLIWIGVISIILAAVLIFLKLRKP